MTVEEQSREVLSIRRNYKQDDPNKEKRSHFVHYRFVPGFGFYGLGLIHFLGNLTMSATAAMRSLIDAGQFANLPGGFKAKGSADGWRQRSYRPRRVQGGRSNWH